MSDLDLYRDHLDELTRRWGDALEAARLDAVLIAAGHPGTYFLDDQGPAFRTNPHFAQWLPGNACPNAMLLLRPDREPRLYIHQERDYWHQPAAVPDVGDHFDVRVFADVDALAREVCADIERLNRTAYVGAPDPLDDNLPVAERNPSPLLNRVHFGRARKTAFEIQCMRRATEIGVRGHLAARDAFRAGGSEFDIHQAYLRASRQNETALPYGNIVALNEHAGILHYQHQERTSPDQVRSFLIDAGGAYRGYASDITRTYATAEAGLFGDLIARLDTAQQSLIAELAPSADYVEVHESAHRRIAEILVAVGIVRDSPDAAFETGVTDAFFPHGLGHLLGLQVHDAGGHLVSANGGVRPPPPRYPALRMTRRVEAGQVFTVEPGIYFIPMLLEALREGPNAKAVDWAIVQALLPCGGIRIEDNVHVTETGIENLTRDAFAAAES